MRGDDSDGREVVELCIAGATTNLPATVSGGTQVCSVEQVIAPLMLMPDESTVPPVLVIDQSHRSGRAYVLLAGQRVLGDERVIQGVHCDDRHADLRQPPLRSRASVVVLLVSEAIDGADKQLVKLSNCAALSNSFYV